jgi:putative transposase
MKSFKTQLKLNDKQRTNFSRHAGVGRYAYNWAVDLVEHCYRYDINLSAIDLHKMWVATVKKENGWVRDVSKCSPQQSFTDLHLGLKKFWAYKKQIKGKKLPLQKIYKRRVLQKVGNGFILKKEWQGKNIPLLHHLKFPNFKRKNEFDGFFLETTRNPIEIENKRIKLPVIGWVNTYESLPNMITKSVRITKKANNWFISYIVEQESVLKTKGETGVDLGIKTLATLSDGTTFETPKRYEEAQKRLARLQRSQSRKYLAHEKRVKESKGNKTKGISKNYQKTNLRIQKEHNRISCLRLNSLHHLTTYLAKNHSKITIEDLNVSGMMKNHNLAGAIANGSFYEFKRQLAYKSKWYEAELVIADQFFASSKTCSCCGHKQDMPLKKRVFECEECPNVMDRDVNAAINLMNYKNYAGSQSVKACGDTKFHNASLVGVSEAGIKRKSVN